MAKCEACEKELGVSMGIFKEDISIKSGYPKSGIKFKTRIYCLTNKDCEYKVTGKVRGGKR